MNATTTVVLSGGPQGGKSTLLRRLADDQEIAPLLTAVPEAATMLFGGGHPTPDGSWGDQDWYNLQLAITSLQISLEGTLAGRTPLTVCDRAPVNNLAYSFGREALELFWGGGFASQMSRYDLVLHMESLATAGPELFGRVAVKERYEALAEAQVLEMRTREVWQAHPNWQFVSGSRPFEEVLADATERIRSHLRATIGT